MNKDTINKVLWRLEWVREGFFPLFGALFFDLNKQPWEYIWDYLFLSSEKRYSKSGYYLAKYFKTVEEKESVLFYFKDVVLKIDRRYLDTAKKLDSILVQYFDIIYSSTVNFPIPGIMPEGPYEKGVLKLEEGDVVIDAGANFGVFTFFAGKKIGNTGKVYAFEPIEDIGKNLNSAKILNNLENNIETVSCALGDSEDDLEFHFSEENYASSSISLGNENKVSVKQTTLDNFVEKNNLEKVSFIKMDIEGMERKALVGASKTIKRFKPKLAVCTYHFSEDRELLTKIIKNIRPDYNFIYSKMKLFAW